MRFELQIVAAKKIQKKSNRVLSSSGCFNLFFYIDNQCWIVLFCEALTVPDMYVMLKCKTWMFVVGVGGWIQVLGGRVPLHGGWRVESCGPHVQRQWYVGGRAQGRYGHICFVGLLAVNPVKSPIYVEFCTPNVWTLHTSYLLHSPGKSRWHAWYVSAQAVELWKSYTYYYK